VSGSRHRKIFISLFSWFADVKWNDAESLKNLGRALIITTGHIMNKKAKWNFGCLMAGLCFAGLGLGVAWGDTQSVPFVSQHGGTNTIPCPGVFYGYAYITNSSGKQWVIPTNNVTGGTLTDLSSSSFGSNYVSVACVIRKGDGFTWCGTNTVTFPATNAEAYSLIVYVKSPTPPPASKQTINLQVNWSTN